MAPINSRTCPWAAIADWSAEDWWRTTASAEQERRLAGSRRSLLHPGTTADTVKNAVAGYDI
jgi:hypothetical protein